MRSFILILIINLITSCETREVKYSGLSDLVVGVEQIVLYTNEEFYIEIGLGGYEGRYKIRGDTVYLKFIEKDTQFLPQKLLMTEKYFIANYPNSTVRETRIKRDL